MERWNGEMKNEESDEDKTFHLIACTRKTSRHESIRVLLAFQPCRYEYE